MEFWNYVSNVGNISSIVGTVISIYLLSTVKKIKNHFLLRARVPEILKVLKKNANDLSDQLRQFENSQKNIEVIFGKIESILKNLVPKITGSTQKSAKFLVKKIQKNKGTISEDLAWELYTELHAVIEELKQYHEDMKWDH